MDDFRSFMVDNNADPSQLQWIDEYNAYKSQTQGQKPRRNGVRIPTNLWKGLPMEFQQAWPKLTDAQQHQIGSLCGKSMKNSELSVYQAHNGPGVYFAPPAFNPSYYAISQASSVDDDSSFVLSDASDGESGVDIDSLEIEDESRDDQQLTVQKAAAMKKAPGNKIHSANGKRRKSLPKKSSMAVGAAARFMAAPPYQIIDQQGKVVLLFNADARHQINKCDQYQISMAKTYKQYFSKIPMNETDNNTQLITYETSVNLQKIKESIKALIDGGANGGIGGTEDLTLIGFHPEHKKVNVGIAGDHQMTGLQLAIFAGAIMTHMGLIIGIFHNYARCRQQARSIHSKIQLKDAGATVDDTSKHFNGTQTITLLSGHRIPMQFSAGLPYIETRPVTKAELNDPNIPHVV